MPHPLPWYIAGPLIGLTVPALLLAGNKAFGVSSTFRHLCAAVAPCGIEFFRHDWKRAGVPCSGTIPRRTAFSRCHCCVADRDIDTGQRTALRSPLR